MDLARHARALHLFPAVLAVALGCSPKDDTDDSEDSVHTGDSADTEDTGQDVPLPTSIRVTATGLPLVQGVGASGGGRRSPSDWCAEAGVAVDLGTTAHVAGLAPIRGPSGYIRLPQVVRLDDTTCSTVGAITEPDADLFTTGFGGSVLEHEDDEWEQAAGLMIRVAEVGDEVWLFHNAARGFWRIASGGTATHSTVIPGFTAGVALDGAGGVWVTTLEEVEDVEGGPDEVTPPRLYHLTAAGAVDSTLDLPFTSFQSGFEGGDDQGRVATFLSQAISVGPDGRVWILHSGNRLVVSVDPVTQAVASHPLDVWYPTGLAWAGDHLLIATGLHVEEDLDILQAPKLLEFHESSGTTTAVLDIPPPNVGWHLTSGFEGDGDPEVSGRIPMMIWFDLVATDDGLLVADPAHGRVLQAS